MKFIQQLDNGYLHCSLSEDELRMIRACLAELCYGGTVFDYEFKTRTGYTKDEVGKLIQSTISIMDELSIDL